MVDEGWFTDADGLSFRMRYRTVCEPCGEEKASHDLDEVIGWSKEHRHITMSFVTEFGDAGSLPREVPSERLDGG